MVNALAFVILTGFSALFVVGSGTGPMDRSSVIACSAIAAVAAFVAGLVFAR